VSFGELFLTHPQQLPAADASEPWGSECVGLGIAGTTFHMSGLSAAQARTVSARFNGWLTDDSSPAEATISVAVRRIGDEYFRPFDRRGWVYSFDRHYTRDTVWLAGPDFVARFAPGRPLLGTQWLPNGGDDDLFLTPFENFLRVLLAYRLMQRGGVLFHSCGVDVDGSAVLFFGRSGAGKSTMGRRALAAGHRILSDDINAVDRRQGALCATAVPFAGELAAQTPGGGWLPVTRMVQLARGEALSSQALSPATAVAALAVCAPVVNDDPERSHTLIDNLGKIVEKVPVLRLHCPLEAKFPDIVAIL